MILTVHDCSVGVGEVGLGDAVLYPNRAKMFFEVDPGPSGWTVRAFDLAGRDSVHTMDGRLNGRVRRGRLGGQYLLQFQDENASSSAN